MSSASKPPLSAQDVGAVEAGRRMDRMYRIQRHIYNATRRYYLLGRDRLISNMHLTDGAEVLEIGCGTGRNLVLTALRYPKATCFGLDISAEMLTSAVAAIARHDLGQRVHVARGDGAAFDAKSIFGTGSFDDVLISYSLSMIPDWQAVLEAAVRDLKPGGRLHVVDFGQQERMPGLIRSLLLRWLALFAVIPRDDLERVMLSLANRLNGSLLFERPFRGYAQYAILSFPATIISN